MADDLIAAHRAFLKDDLRLTIDFRGTAQSRGLAPPPLQKPAPPDRPLIPLPDRSELARFSGSDLLDAIAGRRSHRRYAATPLELDELALLLWATQGITEQLGPGHARRTVPSAGCRHAFESYLLVRRVADLEPGVYRYLPCDHALVYLRPDSDLRGRLTAATHGQAFVGAAPVTFAWTVLPWRMEWRYHTVAHRVLLMDVGHLCQNLYLACAAIDAGTCAVAAYHQAAMDELLGVDGENEFTVYLAPVGKLPA